jgi:hypothetical protein
LLRIRCSSEDDASIAEGARFIWRQNRIVCQRVEDNAFHLVYQLSVVAESVTSVVLPSSIRVD